MNAFLHVAVEGVAVGRVELALEVISARGERAAMRHAKSEHIDAAADTEGIAVDGDRTGCEPDTDERAVNGIVDRVGTFFRGAADQRRSDAALVQRAGPG